MKIRVINPTISEDFQDGMLATYKAYASSATDISVVFLEHGPASIESYYDVALAAPDILGEVIRGEEQGMDAVVIDCMFDPALFAARERVTIPVVGAAQASMSLAATLGDRFSVIGILERDRAPFHDLWRLYGLTSRGASVRVIDIPVLSLQDDEEALIKAMISEGVLAITEDHAHALVFGCTGMGGLKEEVERGLAEKGYVGVPVIDPSGAAVKQAESQVALGLSHSKLTFPEPTRKKIAGYDKLQL